MARFSMVLSVACMLHAAAAAAQDYPAKTINLVVPFPAGGLSTIFAKTLADNLGEQIGQPVVVENRGGRFGATGSEYVAKAAPDGYTLLLATTSSHAVAPAGLSPAPYDPATGFTPVRMLAEIPYILVVSPKLSVNSPSDLIEQARQKPGALTFGASGQATVSYLMAAYFMDAFKLKLTPAEYRPPNRTYAGLDAGEIAIFFDSSLNAMTEITRGRARGLAVLGYSRSTTLSQLPLIRETNPQFRATQWIGLVGPRGMPEAIVSKLNGTLKEVLQLPQVKEKLAAFGAEVLESTPEDFEKFLSYEPAKWKRIIQENGIKLPQ